MNPKTIWKLDRLVGSPACALLSLMERIRRVFVRPARRTPRRILFVKLIEMGSTVIACPAFEEATRMVGKENVFILVFSPNRVIVDLLPYFPHENVLTIDDTNLGTFLAGLLGAIRRIRKENIDTAIDMEGLTRSSAIITYLTGARTRVGYHNFTSEGPYRGRLFTHELNYTFQRHVSRMFLALVRAAAASPEEVPLLKETIPESSITLPSIDSTDEEKKQVLGIIADRTGGAKPGTIVLLNPNCSDLLPLRRWPTENFVELGKQLLAQRDDSTVIITGAPDEKSEAERIAAQIGDAPRVLSLAGHTTLRQLFALYNLSRVLVSNDSGPCHFATLTSIRIIALFGPETPVLYAPLGKTARSLCSNLACSPCVNILNHRFSPCQDNKCMQAISLQEVLAATIDALSA